LADTVAAATREKLFIHNERMVLLREGELVDVSLAMLGGIITENVVTQKLVNRGTRTRQTMSLCTPRTHPARGGEKTIHRG
jgi:hypothetical protein